VFLPVCNRHSPYQRVKPSLCARDGSLPLEREYVIGSFCLSCHRVEVLFERIRCISRKWSGKMSHNIMPTDKRTIP
jgi:hypothetical protein